MADQYRKKFSELTSEEFWIWWGRTSPTWDPRYRDVMPAGEGVKGGQSSKGKKRKKPVKKPTIYDFYE